LQAALALVVPRAITPANTNESNKFLRNFMKFPSLSLVFISLN